MGPDRVFTVWNIGIIYTLVPGTTPIKVILSYQPALPLLENVAAVRGIVVGGGEMVQS